jgi:hypothetical protein
MMAEGKNKALWCHTSSLMALIANCHRDPKKTSPYKPDHFNPYAKRDEGRPLTREEAAELAKQWQQRAQSEQEQRMSNSS